MKVVITGATGFVGQALVPVLRARGDEVIALSRDAARAQATLGAGVTAVTADLEAPGAWTAVLAGAGAVVHLAGEPVAGRRWSARQRQVIRDSRVESTRTIVEAIGALPAGERPASLINASGTDYYPFAEDGPGDDDDEVTEDKPPGDSFLARVCRDWEAEARAAEALGVRVVMMRTGLVLGGGGGALAKMTTPFRFFIGGRIGSGRQWLPWIHRDDAALAYAAAVHDDQPAGPVRPAGPEQPAGLVRPAGTEQAAGPVRPAGTEQAAGPVRPVGTEQAAGYRGPINLVTDSIRNRDFAAALGRTLGRPSWLPVPGFAVRAAAGELAEYLLHGRRVVPARLRALGFAWKHPELGPALEAALVRDAG